MKYRVNTNELKKAMIDANIQSISDFSVATGVNRNTLSDIINGKARPSTIVIEKMSNTLNLDGDRVGRIFFTSELA